MRFQAKVLMLGRSGVGKTSLLASMFNALQTHSAFAGLVAMSEKSHELDIALAGLRRYIRTLAEGRPEANPPTAVRKDYPVTLKLPGTDHSLDIAFCDMPGEWLDDSRKKAEWIDLIRDSDIVVNVISAPAMMEHRREYNEDINKPSRFNEYIGAALGNENYATKSFFLVPVKCEKYMESPAALVSTIREVYGNHRALLRAAGHFCYALPVNTLGSVVFDRFTLSTRGDPLDHYVFRRGSPPEWQPKNHDVQMAQILDYFMACFQASFPSGSGSIQRLRAQLAGHLGAELLEGPTTPKYRIFKADLKKSCFGPETKVALGDGRLVPISSVAAGMRVLSAGERGQLIPAVVGEVQRHANQPMMELVVEDRVLRVTARHPLRIGGKWRRARDLHIGDCLDTFDGWARVTGISRELVVDDAYNLVVRGCGCYFAEGVLASSFVTLNGLRQWTNGLRSSTSYRDQEAHDG